MKRKKNGGEGVYIETVRFFGVSEEQTLQRKRWGGKKKREGEIRKEEEMGRRQSSGSMVMARPSRAHGMGFYLFQLSSSSHSSFFSFSPYC